MSYFVEFGQSRYEAFYQEFLMLDATSGDALPSAGIDHQLKVCGEVCDYGEWFETGQIVASNSNGLIYPTTQRGVSAIKIPPSAFGACLGCGDDYGFSRGGGAAVRCALLAVPTLADDAKLIFTGTITFGAQTMNPRLSLRATPYYPAPQVPSPSVTQVKIQLAAQSLYDAVEAGLPAPPLDPARQAWSSGGSVSQGGPLANVIASVNSWNAAAMAIFLTAAAAQPT